MENLLATYYEKQANALNAELEKRNAVYAIIKAYQDKTPNGYIVFEDNQMPTFFDVHDVTEESIRAIKVIDDSLWILKDRCKVNTSIPQEFFDNILDSDENGYLDLDDLVYILTKYDKQ